MDLGRRPPLSGGVIPPASGAGPNAPIMGAFHWCRLQWMQEGTPPTLLHWIHLGVPLPIWQLPALHTLHNHCLSLGTGATSLSGQLVVHTGLPQWFSPCQDPPQAPVPTQPSVAPPLLCIQGLPIQPQRLSLDLHLHCEGFHEHPCVERHLVPCLHG